METKIKQTEVIFRAVELRNSVLPFNEWMGLGGRLDIHPFFRYKLDKDGEYIKDTNGNKVPIMEPSFENPSVMKPQRFDFRIEKRGQARFLFPQDRDKIDALRNCPHNKECNNIDGVDYSGFTKRFYEYNPEKIETKRMKDNELKWEMVDFASSVKKEFAYVYCLILGISLKSELTQHNKNNIALFNDVREYAERTPISFKEQIIDNPQFKMTVMVKLSLHKNLINKNHDGYFYDGTLIGTTETRVIEYLEQPIGHTVRSAIEKSLNWNEIEGNIANKKNNMAEETESVASKVDPVPNKRVRNFIEQPA